MPEIAIQLNPRLLGNPNLDIRYLLPDLLTAWSGGSLIDDGYDYGRKSDLLTIYLRTDDLEAAVHYVLEVLQNESVLGNHLATSGVIVATSPRDSSEEERDYTVIFPANAPPFTME